MAGQWRWRDELDAARCLRDRRQREAGSARAARSDPGSWWSRCDVERLDVARGGVRLSWRSRAALLQLCLAKDADAVKGKGKKERKEEEEEEEERRRRRRRRRREERMAEPLVVLRGGRRRKIKMGEESEACAGNRGRREF
ncbi:hypothetical protein JCGZ_00503 [Jatropha curcas]|uniref:Uncharacterized protein n=1 Tax=Jatropha curcas TaxID=180498 RepID=A0A067JSX0_JATCU|nr:hypothetical protein JCGZ_00503 [Jatropha curcas]